MLKPSRTVIAALAMSMFAVGCAGATTPGGGDTPADAIPHPTGADQLALREATGGGFIPIEYNLSAMPGFSLYGDGTVLTQGPMIEIYPPPAVPFIQKQVVTEEGMQAILQAAEEAGLFADNEYTGMTKYVADVGTTTYTVTTEDTYQTSIYGLGMTAGPGEGTPEFDIPAAEREADKALSEFSAKLFDLESWLPKGSVSEFTTYDATEWRIYVRDYGKPADPSLTQNPVDWPLNTPLAKFGGATDSEGGLDYRCGTVEGDDLATLLPEAQASNTETPWTSEGKEYRLVFRPLLPDESGC